MKRPGTAAVRCLGCGAKSEPRPIGEAPPGWRRFVSKHVGAVTYRCEHCLRMLNLFGGDVSGSRRREHEVE